MSAVLNVKTHFSDLNLLTDPCKPGENPHFTTDNNPDEFF